MSQDDDRDDNAYYRVTSLASSPTLRDLFAMAALAGFLASEEVGGESTFESAAADAWGYADAMMAARGPK